MRCLSAFASFERYTHTRIQTQTHSQIHFAKWENVSVAPSCGNSCCSQQKARPNDDDDDNNPQSTWLQRSPVERASCILYLTDTHATCALSFAYRVFFAFFFVSFFFCFCISFLSASASRQTVYKQQSWRLASPRRAVCHNIATCRICNVTSFTRWPIKLAEREGRGGRERERERKVCVCA